MQPRSKSSHFTFRHIALHAVTAIFYLFLPQSCHRKTARNLRLECHFLYLESGRSILD